MPPKDVRGVPNVTGQGENIQSLLASLRDAYNSLAASLRGRHITDFDIAGSLALQENTETYGIYDGVIDLEEGAGQNTASRSMIAINTEGSTPTDNLDTINGGRDGLVLILRSYYDDHIVTIKNGTGNIFCNGDITLATHQFAILVYSSVTGYWLAQAITPHIHATPATGGVIDHGGLSGLADDDHPQYLTPAEHTAIGDAAPHHAPVTIGVDVEHSLVGQVLSGVDAAAAQKGHIQLAGELGGTAALPTITAVHSGSAHHAPVTLGGGSDPALALAGQQLTLADVLTPAEHTAIGNAAPHHAAITLGGGSDAALALAGQQLTLADVLTPAEHTAIGDGAPHHARAHVILSSSDHTDTLTGSVLDGDVIIGNVTPAWSRLAIAIPAANVRNVLGIDNAELRPSWKTALDATNPANIAAAASPGTSLVFAHRDHVHAHPDLGDLHTGYLLATGARVGASAQAQSFGALGIKADLGVESTLNAGMTFEGVLLKDGNVGIGAAPTSKLHITDATNMPNPPDINSVVAFKISGGGGGTEALLMDSNQIESIGSPLYLNARPTGGTGLNVNIAGGGGKVGIGGGADAVSILRVVGLPVYLTNALAVAGGLGAGALYRTNLDPDTVCVVH